MYQMMSILLVDDQQLFREGVKQALISERDVSIVFENNGDDHIMEQIKEYKPHIVIIDINIKQINAMNVIKEMMASFPCIKVVVLSLNNEKRVILKTIKMGVHGYIPKTVSRDLLIAAIKTVSSGETYLHPDAAHYVVQDYQRLLKTKTGSFKSEYKKPLHILSKRECEVLQLLSEGLNNQSISERLDISLSTCKNHVNSILKKMNVNARTLAIVIAIRNGWVKFETNPKLSYPSRDEAAFAGC